MEEVGCFLKLVKGGSYVLLGNSTLISAVALEQDLPTTLACKQEPSIKILPNPFPFHTNDTSRLFLVDAALVIMVSDQ